MKVLLLALAITLAFPSTLAADAPTGPATTGGLVSNEDLHTEPYFDNGRSDADQLFRGQVPIVGGFANDVTFTIGNPLGVAVPIDLAVSTREDNFQCQPDRPCENPPANITSLVLAPHSKLTRTLRITPPEDSKGYQIQLEARGTSAAWARSVNGGNHFTVVPPVRVDLVSPTPAKGLATISSMQGGGGGFSNLDLAFAPTSQSVSFKARVTNDGATSQSFRLRISSDQTQSAGTLVPVDALAPGTSREVDLGTVDPIKLDPEIARSYGMREYGFSVSLLRPADKPDEFAPTAASWTVANGLATALTPASVAIGFRHDFAVDAFAPTTAKLGSIVGVDLVARQFGTTTEKNNEIVVTFDPPFNAEYSVQGAQRSTYVETVAPGDSRTHALPFRPLVAGRWGIVVQWDSDQGSNGKATSVFTIDVPTDVDVSVLGTDGPRALALGGFTTAPVHITALRDLKAATLRLTTGTALSTNGGGDGPQIAVSGLSSSVVQASPAEIPIGDLAAGQSYWTNVTVTSTGTGDFNIVPYVIAGGYAYTGIPEITSSNNGGPRTTVATNGPVFEVLVKPHATPPALAFAPAAVVLLLGVAAHFVRRKMVK